MSFSDRIGVTTPKSVLQADDIDKDLRNGLWQACLETHFKKRADYYSIDRRFQQLMTRLFVDFWKLSADGIPRNHDSSIKLAKDWFFKAKWWQIYNLIEFLLAFEDAKTFGDRVAFFLEREKSAYRILEGQLVPISSALELDEVSRAASLEEKFAGAREHIKSAVSLFSQKPTPDFRNSIKESISAVESVARILTNNPKATLGDALKLLNGKMAIHGALREAMSKLYGYTSDEGGIRHSLLNESNIDEAEAKFMIVACSAFVNFCVQRSITSS